MEMKGNSLIPHIFIKPHNGLGTVTGARRAVVNETLFWRQRTGEANDTERLRGELQSCVKRTSVASLPTGDFFEVQ